MLLIMILPREKNDEGGTELCKLLFPRLTNHILHSFLLGGKGEIMGTKRPGLLRKKLSSQRAKIMLST